MPSPCPETLKRFINAKLSARVRYIPKRFKPSWNSAMSISPLKSVSKCSKISKRLTPCPSALFSKNFNRKKKLNEQWNFNVY